MEEIALEAEIREGLGRSNVKALRTSGFIPGIVYGEGKHSLVVQF